MMTGMSWRIRPFTAAADRAWVGQLWQASMPPSWPELPAGIGQLDEGLVAQAGAVPAGFVAFDRAGSIPADPGPDRPSAARDRHRAAESGPVAAARGLCRRA